MQAREVKALKAGEVSRGPGQQIAENKWGLPGVITPPKTNMEPENDGF